MREPVRAGVGDGPAPRSFGPVTQTDIVRFAGAGGDFNPLHHDPGFAASAGFGRPIAMGQFSAALLAAWLTDWCGVEHLREFGVRFSSPVAIGDVVDLAGAVERLEPLQGNLALARLSVTATSGDRIAVSARALVTVTAPARSTPSS